MDIYQACSIWTVLMELVYLNHCGVLSFVYCEFHPFSLLAPASIQGGAQLMKLSPENFVWDTQTMSGCVER